MSKWSKTFWIDLTERVGATLIGGLITLISVEQIGNLSADQAWAIVILPTLVSLLKGLLANMAQPDSGASAVPHPPGPRA